MDKTPTAAEILAKHSEYGVEEIEDTSRILLGQDEVLPAMIEFAQLHVRAALEASSKTIRQEYLAQGADISVAKKKILSSYSPNLIQ